MALVTCDRTGDALTAWLKQATPEQKDKLAQGLSITADVQISPDSGNQLEKRPNGLYASSAPSGVDGGTFN